MELLHIPLNNTPGASFFSSLSENWKSELPHFHISASILFSFISSLNLVADENPRDETRQADNARENLAAERAKHRHVDHFKARHADCHHYPELDAPNESPVRLYYDRLVSLPLFPPHDFFGHAPLEKTHFVTSYLNNTVPVACDFLSTLRT